MGLSGILIMVRDYNPEIMLVLIIALVIIVFILCILFARVNGLRKKYDRMMSGSSAENIESLILEYKTMIDENSGQLVGIRNNIHRIENTLRNCIQQVGMVRYNAFQDTGSDLSFSLALLDRDNSGVIISSIYGRNESIVYAKPVLNGKSKYVLSDEETEALNMAMK